MQPAALAALKAAITEAHAFAEAGQHGPAVQSFALARAMALDLADPKAVQKKVDNALAGYRRERETYRARLAAKVKAQPEKLVVLADSLGLPRPEEAGQPPKTYSWLLQDATAGPAVDSLCQRFFTSDTVLAALEEDPTLGVASDVVIHVGLNDCANRMYLEPERLALSLLPADVNEQVVEFSRKYRAQILRRLPSRHYVPIDRFRANLDVIANLLIRRGARHIILTTIILPPVRFWPATPGVNANFARYNLEIMQAAARHDVQLLDLDRLVWQDLSSDPKDENSPLLADGMHLSHAGHRLMAKAISDMLRQKPKPRVS